MSWETIPLKRVATFAAGGTPSVDEPQYWKDGSDGHPWVAIGDMSNVDTVTKTSRRISASGLRSARITLGRPGTILFSMYASLGHTAWLSAPAAWNQAILGLWPGSATDARFLRYCLVSIRPQLLEQVRSNTQANLNAEVVGNLRLPNPQLDQQRRIADFLDAETARIDGLATARQRMRDLLTVRRERTVEKILGLDESPPMIPLKYVVEAVSVGIVITPANWYVDGGGIPALRGVNIQPGRIDGSNMVQISKEGHLENAKSRLSAGDVVVVRTGQAGAAAIVPSELDGCNCIDLLIIRPGMKASSSFIAHYVNSFYAQDKITEHSVGSIQSHFNVASMKNLDFPKIDLNEQHRRAAELDEIISELDALSTHLDAQLALLAERRQALITAAVTGGITV